MRTYLKRAGDTQPFDRRQVEDTVRRRDGTERTVAWHNSVLRDAEGRITGALSSGEDVTSTRAAESALRRSERWHRHLVGLLQEGIWMIDAEARTSFVNEHMAAMLGYSVDEMIGRSVFDFMDESWSAVGLRQLARRRAGQASGTNKKE